MRRRKKKRRRLLKRIRGIFIFVGLIVIAINVFNYFKNMNDHINIQDLNISFYIEGADEASSGKGQVNWKYLAAIDGVRYKNKFSKVDNDSLKDLAACFFANDNVDNGSEYILKSLDEVLEELQFEKKEKDKVYRYLEDLKYAGLVSSRLAEESSYMKFINDISDEAIEMYKEYGIFPSVIIAQAILESGWGKSELSMKANNLFGIKADKGWKGKKISMDTLEFYDKNVVASFRMYTNKSESLKDHGVFLYENKRYRDNGIFNAKYYIEQAQALEDAGYSTKEDENGQKIYAELLIELIRQYNLQLLDSYVQTKIINS